MQFLPSFGNRWKRATLFSATHDHAPTGTCSSFAGGVAVTANHGSARDGPADGTSAALQLAGFGIPLSSWSLAYCLPEISQAPRPASARHRRVPAQGQLRFTCSLGTRS